MINRSLMEPLGVYGWGDIEGAVFAALSADVPILFLGSHGTNKTEVSKMLAQLVLGNKARVQLYDTPVLKDEELLGYPNPRSLQEGTELKFVYHKRCVWLQDAIILDEINMASMSTASKLHELTRTRAVMGEVTPVQLVFSTLNPPKEYDTRILGRALASRYACIEAPDLSKLGVHNITRMLLRNHDKKAVVPNRLRLRKTLKASRALVQQDIIPDEMRKRYVALAIKVYETLKMPDSTKKPICNMQSRDLINLYRMLLGLVVFKDVYNYYVAQDNGNTEDDYVPNSEDPEIQLSHKDFIEVVLTCVPEVHGIVKVTTSRSAVEQRLLPILSNAHKDTDEVTIDKFIKNEKVESEIETVSNILSQLTTSMQEEDLINAYAAFRANTNFHVNMSSFNANTISSAILQKLVATKNGGSVDLLKTRELIDSALTATYKKRRASGSSKSLISLAKEYEIL